MADFILQLTYNVVEVAKMATWLAIIAIMLVGILKYDNSSDEDDFFKK